MSRLPGFAALLVILALTLSACTAPQPQPTVDPRAVAEALAELYATQTAEAQPATAEPATPTVATSAPLTDEPATATPTAAPPDTATPTPPCALPVADALAEAWDYARLGCATAEPEVIWSAWQPFERGSMWWRYDTDWSYVLNWQDGTSVAVGDWDTGGDAWRWDGVSFPTGHGLTPPAGLVEPIRGFGFVWFDYLGGPASQIGWGTAEEKGFCATVQAFERGTIWRSNAAVSSCLDGQFNNAVDPAFPSLFFALYEDGDWRAF